VRILTLHAESDASELQHRGAAEQSSVQQ